MNKFVPYRLTQARKVKQWNMTQLAEKIGVTRQSISQFENDINSPSSRTLFDLATYLGQPENYFFKPLTKLEEADRSPPTFRSMASSTAKARGQSESLLEISASIISYFSQIVQFPEANVPDFNIRDFHGLSESDIDQMAEKTRRYFNLGDGPISDLTLLLENNGIILSTYQLDKKLDALSQWFGQRPFILVDSKTFCARMRFSLAHELGHLVLHRNLLEEEDYSNKDSFKLIEKQADRFSGAFLMPESSFLAEVYRTDWDSLIRLKKRWNVSIAAIIMRLHALDVVSESQRSRLFQIIAIKKARLIEPLDKETPKEKPRLLTRVVDILEENNVIKSVELSENLRLKSEFISELTSIDSHRLIAHQGSHSIDNVILFKKA